jgi:hypothetical protein
MDEGHFQAEYFNQTTVHPVGLAMLLLLSAAMIVLPRKWALVPVILIACFIAPGQRVVIASLDFTFLRLLVMFGWMRIMLLGEFTSLIWKPLDTALVVWAFFAVLLGTVSGGHDSQECMNALVFHLGRTYDAIGAYFLFRCLIRSWEDFDKLARCFIWVSLPVAGLFTLEYMTRQNLFSVFGGVRAITDIREGRLRCQGAFAHPILAGSFWATIIPLMATQLWRGHKWKSLLGMTAALGIVVMCASSTPILAIVAGLVGAAFFVLRRYMRLVRWSLVALIVALQLVMNAPVYHLISRIDVVGGSTGYHRYRLIDKWVQHMHEWWLFGSADGSEHWGDQLFDVTNYYIQLSLQGGFPLLILFIIVLAYAFSAVGRTVRRERNDRSREIAAWALGVSLFQHVATYFGVTYFGQIIILWFMLLAVIGSLAPGGFAVFRRARVSHPIRRFEEEEPGVAVWDEEPVLSPNPSGHETSGALA